VDRQAIRIRARDLRALICAALERGDLISAAKLSNELEALR
jgi:hypothetical protein